MYSVDQTGMIINRSGSVRMPQIGRDNPTHPLHYQWQAACNRITVLMMVALALVFRILEVGLWDAVGDFIAVAIGWCIGVMIVWITTDVLEWLHKWLNGR